MKDDIKIGPGGQRDIVSNKDLNWKVLQHYLESLTRQINDLEDRIFNDERELKILRDKLKYFQNK